MKKNVNTFTENLIRTIQAKKQTILDAVENETRKSGENVEGTKGEFQQKKTMIESSLEEADKLLKRSTNADVIQFKYSLTTILKRVQQAEQISRDPVPTVVFVENKKLSEEIGSLQILFPTKASGSIAEGQGKQKAKQRSRVLRNFLPNKRK